MSPITRARCVATGIVLFICLLTLGVAEGVIRREQAINQEESSWAKTDATILASAAKKEPEGKNRQWMPVWSYRYTVNGVNYVSESDDAPTGYYSHRRDTQAQAQEYTNTRPVGSTVEVYYDPINPGRSVLDRAQAAPNDTIVPVLIVVVLFAGLMSVPIFLLKPKMKSQ